MDEIKYLDHLVSTEVIKLIKDNIRAMLKWPKPQNIRELRGFIGPMGYYLHFVANYNNITTPSGD